jgi:hypothetical protein
MGCPKRTLRDFGRAPRSRKPVSSGGAPKRTPRGLGRHLGAHPTTPNNHHNLSKKRSRRIPRSWESIRENLARVGGVGQWAGVRSGEGGTQLAHCCLNGGCLSVRCFCRTGLHRLGELAGRQHSLSLPKDPGDLLSPFEPLNPNPLGLRDLP